MQIFCPYRAISLSHGGFQSMFHAAQALQSGGAWLHGGARAMCVVTRGSVLELLLRTQQACNDACTEWQSEHRACRIVRDSLDSILQLRLHGGHGSSMPATSSTCNPVHTCGTYRLGRVRCLLEATYGQRAQKYCKWE
jgi:hypothetical protein